jgi:hypothetical protein
MKSMRKPDLKTRNSCNCEAFGMLDVGPSLSTS